MPRKKLPNDIIPSGGGKLIITEVLPDGSDGKIVGSFANFLISVTPTTARTSNELDVGQGPNIPFPLDETQNLAIVVNAYNAEFHALLTGEQHKVGQKIVLNDEVAKIVKSGEVGSEVYSYTFPDEKKPVANEDGIYILLVQDQFGNNLQDDSKSTETLTSGKYKYDSDTGVLTVSSDYENETLNVDFYFSVEEVETTSASKTLATKEFKIQGIATVQSAKGKGKYKRVATIDRAVFTGDVPAIPQQKEINTNMTYNVASQEPRAGKDRYSNDVYKL